ncbi:MAG: alpha/beta hydrolase [Rhizobacter sp.]|nr:alpha/beta hydrolase [Ferruginibacter sp.]
MKKIIVIYSRIALLYLFVISYNPLLAQHTLKIQVTGIPSLHKEDAVYVAGNFNGWNPVNPAYELKRKDGKLELIIPALKDEVCEFKFTRGGWDKVACTASGADVGNNIVKLIADTTLTYSIEAWKDDFGVVEKKHTASVNVGLMDSAFFIPQLNRSRRIWIYLPPSYQSSKKHYPVLYMHDGQNIFDHYTSGFGEWGVDECLDSIMENGRNECIVIGIDNGPKRLNEYNPFNNERFGTGEGKAYAAFVVETLKPFVDGHYRTLKDRTNTIIAGSSMGGLISYYTQLAYPAVFGKAGVFSPAFWTAPGITAATDSLAKTANGKFFFYMGGLEGDEYMNDMYEVMQQLGTRSSALIYSVTDPGGSHNEDAWRKWFPEFFRFIMADWTNYVIKTEEN